MKRSLFTAAAILAVAGAACPSEPVRILFVNNSLTYYNDMPALIDSLGAHADPPIAIRSKMHSIPSSDLGQHLTPSCFDLIDTGGYEFVVLQGYEDPIHAPENFYRDARILHDSIRAAGANAAFYMTWPSIWELDSFDVLIRSYDSIGKELQAPVAPVGRVFKRLLELLPQDQVISDGVHPSGTGSYVAACVIFATLFQRDPRGTTFMPVLTPFTEASPLWTCDSSGAALQRIAWEFTRDYNGPARPLFMPQRNTFWDPVEVTLSAMADDAVIRYTLDGSAPDSASPVYSDPIALSSTTTITAATFADGSSPGLPVTRTYRKIDRPVLTTLRLTGPGKWVLPHEAVRFSATGFDQYHDTIAAVPVWSVSGGGTITSDGLFTSTGDAGSVTLTVRDSASALSKTVVFTIGNGLPLSSDYVRGMLVLRDMSGNCHFSWTGDSTIDFIAPESVTDLYAGNSMIIGDALRVWEWERSETGWWGTGQVDYFIAHWALTVVVTSKRTVRVRYRCNGRARLLHNGAVIEARDSILDDSVEYATPAITLAPGRNRFVFALEAGGSPHGLAIRFIGEDTGDTDGLYYLDEGPASTAPRTARPEGRPAAPILLRFRFDGSRIVFDRPLAGTAELFDARGRLAAREDGPHLRCLPVGQLLAAGRYVLRISTPVGTLSRALVINRSSR